MSSCHCLKIRIQRSGHPPPPPFRSPSHNASGMRRAMERWLCSLHSRGGTTSSKLVAPCRRLPSMKLLRRRLDRRRSCSPRHLHGGASSPASPGPRFGMLGGLLRSAWSALLELLSGRTVHKRLCQIAIFPYKLPRPS
jgi:hypothetical protein